VPIDVRSETGRLKKVMLHRPGKELEHFVPDEMMRLLFDDIPYLAAAQKEHDRFAEILRENGAQVCYLEDLAAEALRAVPEIKKPFIERFIEEGEGPAIRRSERLRDYLMGIEDERALILKMMMGVSQRELGPGYSGSLVAQVRGEESFLLDPIPNLYFTRDPWAAIGEGVSIHHMFSATRRRETIFGELVLKYHPDFAGKVPVYYERKTPYSIEGGDIFNLSGSVIAVGISQRTSPEAIEQLAKNIFADEKAKIRTVVALDIPSKRAFMHLDTVFTQVDSDKFTVHPAILENLAIYELTPGSGREELRVEQVGRTLDEELEEVLGLSGVKLINCGGEDRIAAEREQWNDGSNTLCLAPGKVVVYERNGITNRALRENGVEVIEMPSSELSRGRGGPRCMSMALERE